MNDFAEPLVKIEDTNKFRLVVVSDDPDAAHYLFPHSHRKLSRFGNITSISSFSELLKVYVSNRTDKLAVFIDITSRDSLLELKKMIYGAHAETRGLLFAFTFAELTNADFEAFISMGFDDVFALRDNDDCKYMRIYSWIRRFGAAQISGAYVDRDQITFLSNRRDKRIGRWRILVSEMVACDDGGERVRLTRQEIDFLSLLFEGAEPMRDGSYEKFFKAPHAIVHKLKKKLGETLPIHHGHGGQYYLADIGKVSSR
jgi:hypothetical protein